MEVSYPSTKTGWNYWLGRFEKSHYSYKDFNTEHIVWLIEKWLNGQANIVAQSGVCYRSTLVLILFSIFTNALDDGLACSQPKIWGVTDITEGFVTIQKVIERWGWQKSHEVKQRVVQNPAERKNPIHQYIMESQVVLGWKVIQFQAFCRALPTDSGYPGLHQPGLEPILGWGLIRVEGDSYLLSLLFRSSQATVSLLGWKCTLMDHINLFVHQDP